MPNLQSFVGIQLDISYENSYFMIQNLTSKKFLHYSKYNVVILPSQKFKEEVLGIKKYAQFYFLLNP